MDRALLEVRQRSVRTCAAALRGRMCDRNQTYCDKISNSRLPRLGGPLRSVLSVFVGASIERSYSFSSVLSHSFVDERIKRLLNVGRYRQKKSPTAQIICDSVPTFATVTAGARSSDPPLSGRKLLRRDAGCSVCWSGGRWIDAFGEGVGLRCNGWVAGSGRPVSPGPPVAPDPRGGAAGGFCHLSKWRIPHGPPHTSRL